MPAPTAAKLAKLPFYIGNLLMLEAAFILIFQSRSPIDFWELLLCILCVAIGSILGVWPFVLEYRAAIRMAETGAAADTAAKLKSLEPLAAQIAQTTSQWQTIREAADKTGAAAQSIAERVAAEVKNFNTLLQNSNDGEKAALRLEVEKLRRAETDWLQVAVRMLDHTHAFQRGARQSGQPILIEQTGRLQSSCLEAARRVGLAPFGGEAGEKFDPNRHRLADGAVLPAENPVIAETLANGYSYQGKQLRPALVSLQPSGQLSTPPPPPEATPASTPTKGAVGSKKITGQGALLLHRG